MKTKAFCEVVTRWALHGAYVAALAVLAAALLLGVPLTDETSRALIALWWLLSLVAIGLLNHGRNLYGEYRRRQDRLRLGEELSRAQRAGILPSRLDELLDYAIRDSARHGGDANDHLAALIDREIEAMRQRPRGTGQP